MSSPDPSTGPPESALSNGGQKWRLALGAACGLIAAVIWTFVAGPTYEATAWLEAADDSDLPTMEEKLRFPSLYRAVRETEEEAQDLARRTRAKIRRGSRLIAVTVAHAEPQIAAAEANDLAEVFLATLKLPETSRATAAPVRALPALPDPASADSPESLAEAWAVQSAEFEKLSQRYANDASHPAVVGARQRLDALGKRIAERATSLSRQFGLPIPEADDADTDPAARLRSLQTALAGVAPGRATPTPARGESFPPTVPCRLAERAIPATEPVGPARPAIWLGGLIMGAFAALFSSWCCPCGTPRR